MSCREVSILGISTLIIFDKEKKDVVHESGANLVFDKYGVKVYDLAWNNKFQIVALFNTLDEYECMVAAWRCFFLAMGITGSSKSLDLAAAGRDSIMGTNFYLAYLEIKKAIDEMIEEESMSSECIDYDHDNNFDYDEYNRS